MKTILNSKSGMTLIETIVALLLFGVLATAVTAIMLPVLNTFIRANDLAELTVLVENIGSEIVDDLKQSTTPAEITGDTISIKIESNTIEYQINKDGVLEKKFTTNDSKAAGKHGTVDFFAVFDAKYYKKKELAIKYTNTGSEDKPIYEVKIDITLNNDKTDGSILTNTFVAKPLALHPYS